MYKGKIRWMISHYIWQLFSRYNRLASEWSHAGTVCHIHIRFRAAV